MYCRIIQQPSLVLRDTISIALSCDQPRHVPICQMSPGGKTVPGQEPLGLESGSHTLIYI